MLYIALLPLLALPGALAGPLHPDTLFKRFAKTPTNEQLFCDKYSGNAVQEADRFALAYASTDCTGDSIFPEGYNMEDRGCIKKSSKKIRSFRPGKEFNPSKDKWEKSGTFCLQKYGLKDPKTGQDAGVCGCIDSSELIYINAANEPKCITIEGDYSSFSWERTYDLDPKCPTGCYDDNLHHAAGWDDEVDA